MARWRWATGSSRSGATLRWTAFTLALAVLLAVHPSNAPVGAATLTNGGFTTSATVSAANYSPGDSVPIVARVTSSSAVTATVDVLVRGPTAGIVHHVEFKNQTLTGSEQAFSVPWTAPPSAATGGYTVEIRVYLSGVAQPRHTNEGAGFFTIGMGSPPPAGGPVRIMPLGDSLTDGVTVEGGYRIDLWSMLAAAHHDVDFVGSRYNGPPGLADKNHEGHPGWRIDELGGGLTAWLQAYRPRVVLLLVGTNDMLQDHDVAGAPARLGALLDQITSTLPGVSIVVSSVPRVSENGALQRIQSFNADLPGVVAARGSSVTFVDGYAAIQPAHLDSDGVHLTTDGYSRLAQAWYPTVHAVLNNLPLDTSTSTPTATATSTATAPGTPTPTATPSPSATSTPTPTVTATPTPTPTVSTAPCVPRPPVRLRASRSGPGQIAVTVTAHGIGNLLREIRVGEARNATVVIAGQSVGAGLAVTLPDATTSVPLTITRARPGEAVHVPLVVLDDCGEWRTFIGAGPGAL